MTKTLVIIQSSYIPWKGYFDLLNFADEAVLFDDVQFTTRDWRSRNVIKTRNGPLWLTIPCITKGRRHQLICETEISEPGWAQRHWQSVRHAYTSAPYFEAVAPSLEQAYERAGAMRLLSDINRLFLETLGPMLGVDTPMLDSREITANGSKTDRLVSICQAREASRYLSGPAAQAYIEPEKFAQAGIELAYMDYGDYPNYVQLYPPFSHAVSAVDLLVHVGADAPRYLKSFKAQH